ncbi:MAG: TetR/AcrR family transcriptional regulator [Bacteroidales bacterium]
MNEKESYIEIITQDFLKYGIKSMSMDDIARLLGMSKKTLYQHFKDKNEIVCECIAFIKSKMTHEFGNIYCTEKSFIESEVERSRKMMEGNSVIKPTFIFDLKKFYPVEFAEFKNFKNDLIYKTCRINAENGKKQGLIREDVDIDFISKYCVTMVNAIFSPELSGFSEDDIISGRYANNFLRYSMHALCTPKGIDELNRLMNENNKINS